MLPSVDFHMTPPPETGGSSGGIFTMEIQSSGGIGGRIWPITESDAAPRDGGDFLGFGGIDF